MYLKSFFIYYQSYIRNNKKIKIIEKDSKNIIGDVIYTAISSNNNFHKNNLTDDAPNNIYTEYKIGRKTDAIQE